ncbi:MAG: hypothetical protein AAF801_18075 [Pseudomonadota bacterium]
MNRCRFHKIWTIAIVAGLLGSLAIAAPAYNASHSAPRTVFLTLPDTAPQPDLSLRLTQDQSGHWILWIETTHFQFTDICAAVAQAAPIGHAHIIVDGQKVGSAYGPVYDLGALQAGPHQISVTLRGQDHRALIGKDGLIMAEVTLIAT